eukprot:5627311-Pyramimonas_sp.AAC.1
MKLKIKRKAHRGRCVLSDPPRRNKVIQCCYLGAPVERLMSVLQHRDMTGKILLDITAGPTDSNPIHSCCKDLVELMSAGGAGRLGPVLEYMEEGVDRSKFLEDARAMGAQFLSAVRWRFAECDEFPYRWARLAHPACSAEAKAEIIRS